ncbi:MAG: fused signal recognition particle receptor [Candidatus Woesearchaeota archaeon]|jgi:fused signal recognition particle receptor
MFKFLKDKIKGAIKKFSSDVDESAKDVEVEEPVVLAEPVAEITEVIPEKPIDEPEVVEEVIDEPEEEVVEEPVEEVIEEPEEVVPEVVDEPEEEIEETPIKEPVVKEVEEPAAESFEEADEEPLDEIVAEEKPIEENTAQDLLEEVEEEPIPEEEVIEEPKPKEPVKSTRDELQEKRGEKKGFFSRFTQKITAKELDDAQFEDLFFELELVLLENNVAVEVIEKIKTDLKVHLVGVPIKRSDVLPTIQRVLHESITEVLDVPTMNLLDEVSKKKPYVISFVGVNGAGKTTHLAKIAHYLKKNNLTCVIAACDTFRAAAIQQVEEHATKIGVRLIKHDYGADSAAVAYDAVAHAKAKGLDVVLIDTAGRLHSNSNLMDELAKINRVVEPDLTIFVGESITGNDCVEQAIQFNEKVGIDAIILTKADVDEKGGAAISISYVTKKPILFLGTGQTYDDLTEFNKETVLEQLDL